MEKKIFMYLHIFDYLQTKFNSNLYIMQNMQW